MATVTAAASYQRAQLETLRAELGAANREFARFLARALAADQRPDDEECERLHIEIGRRERASGRTTRPSAWRWRGSKHS
jgi:hypothetical protein